MRWTPLVAALVVLIGGTPTRAQTITIDDINAARAGVRVGYGGKGIDWQTSIDSPLLAGIGRVRADVGLGHWVGIVGEIPPPAGSSPWVTRLGGTGILFLPHADTPTIRPYIGLGVAAYMPHATGMRRQRGVRMIAGLESSGDRWDVAPEVEIDSPTAGGDYRAGMNLIPAFRVGLAIRRRF
jgi:hypothetical protein